ncbi:MAG TPA: hypothetical protein VM166_11650 [Gemmatimonadaceae bacterium]|nr:hypothetical protein [Gemmatimonadaceae bacterium]
MRFFPLLLTPAIIACVTPGQADPALSPPRAFNVISADEIAATHSANVYDLIESIHPLYLTSRIGRAPLGDREVYLDGVRLYGIAALKNIPSMNVREIRLVRPGEVVAGYVGRAPAAILVLSKFGR